MLVSFILKIYTCKPLKFLCSHLKNVGGKVLLGIRFTYKPISIHILPIDV